MSLTSLVGVVLMVALIGVCGGLLGWLNRRFKDGEDGLVEQIDALLPQTQCGQCGYPGCRPYAEAVATGKAAINLCPPGGEDTVNRLAALLGRDSQELAAPGGAPVVAMIDESICIGCTHCRTACPVDAITGGHQFIHTVIQSECTGCELCIAPCPVDCISMVTT